MRPIRLSSRRTHRLTQSGSMLGFFRSTIFSAIDILVRLGHPYAMKLLLAGLLLVFSTLAAATEGTPEHVGITSTYVIGASSVSTQAFAQNLNRDFLLIQNQGASSIWISIGGASTVANPGVVLTSGSSFIPSPPPVGSIFVGSFAGSVNTQVMEGIR